MSAIKFDLVIVNGGPYHILSVISEDRLLVALLNWFFCNQFYRSILLFVHGLSSAACEVLTYSSLLCDCPYVYIFFSFIGLLRMGISW